MFCTVVDNQQRDGWLSYLQRFNVPIVNRKGRKIQKRRVQKKHDVVKKERQGALVPDLTETQSGDY